MGGNMTQNVYHHVLFADLVSLAKDWGISEESLGLEIDVNGNLVPIDINEIDKFDENNMSVGRLRKIAKKNLPRISELELVVVVVYSKKEGPYVCLMSVDDLLNKSRGVGNWWTFSPNYIRSLH